MQPYTLVFTTISLFSVAHEIWWSRVLTSCMGVGESYDAIKASHVLLLGPNFSFYILIICSNNCIMFLFVCYSACRCSKSHGNNRGCTGKW